MEVTWKHRFVLHELVARCKLQSCSTKPPPSLRIKPSCKALRRKMLTRQITRLSTSLSTNALRYRTKTRDSEYDKKKSNTHRKHTQEQELKSQSKHRHEGNNKHKENQTKMSPAAAATSMLLNSVCPSCGKRGLHKHGNPPKDPKTALQYLREGNQRFVKGEILAPNRSLEIVKRTQAGQAPYAAFLSCADSRVPVEIIFDQGFGDVFITRVAGNIVTTEVIASLEFGTAVLGSKVLYVLGHTKCGAVAATAAGNPVPGVISSLYYSIKPACETANNDVEEAIKENVKNQAKALAVSPVIAGLVKENKLTIVGGVYDLATGKVTEVSLK
eukprot:g79490.t1